MCQSACVCVCVCVFVCVCGGGGGGGLFVGTRQIKAQRTTEWRAQDQEDRRGGGWSGSRWWWDGLHVARQVSQKQSVIKAVSTFNWMILNYTVEKRVYVTKTLPETCADMHGPPEYYKLLFMIKLVNMNLTQSWSCGIHLISHPLYLNL